MFKHRFCPFVFVLTVLLLVQAACALPFTGTAQKEPDKPVPQVQSDQKPIEEQPEVIATVGTAETEVPTLQPTQKPESTTAPIGPPTPTAFVYNGQPPNAGTGGVYGRLLWNEKPVAGVQVKLCDEIKFIGGCKGTEYPATTDANGVYTILNVPPGSYGLTFRALDANTWFFVTSSILNAKDFEIAADKMVNVGDYSTVRLDLVITSPKKDERMSEARPKLEWEPYPEADHYELTFHSGRGGSLINGMELVTTNFTLDRDLQSCDYSFKIEAFNSKGNVIAESNGWQRFSVRGLPQNCVLVALSPADGATMNADNIVLKWQPHDWAAEYKIHMYAASESSKKILDFVKTNTTDYTVTQNVPAGNYIWVVYAYDEYGDCLGFSDQFKLNVTNP